MMQYFARIILGCAALMACPISVAWADQPGSKSPADSTKQKSSRVQAKPAADNSAAVSEVSEMEVLDFVRQHQPELADLLAFLKKKQSGDYTEALRESRKVRDRLMIIQQRDSELYEVELAIWKNTAQLRLWAAAVSAKSKKLDDDDRIQLKKLLKSENDLNLRKLSLEKVRTEARLNQINQQLSRRQEQSDTILNKSLKTWENRIERSSKSKTK